MSEPFQSFLPLEKRLNKQSPHQYTVVPVQNQAIFRLSFIEKAEKFIRTRGLPVFVRERKPRTAAVDALPQKNGPGLKNPGPSDGSVAVQSA
ncbi:MAG: hypothetical protein IKP09_08445 [Lentisphaeria bacterium]|nr:hypothetical protein [Lentisphaeria bacterium]